MYIYIYIIIPAKVDLFKFLLSSEIWANLASTVEISIDSVFTRSRPFAQIPGTRTTTLFPQLRIIQHDMHALKMIYIGCWWGVIQNTNFAAK